MHQTEKTVKSHIDLRTKIFWGAGGLAGYIMFQTFFALAIPIYQVAMKLNPVKLGIIMAIPRFLDAITDPLMGSISDNTHSRWGRRRPYMLIGVILCGIILPLIWMPPFKSENWILGYFLIMASLFSLTYTMFDVSYTALGYELTTDYDERTKVLVWRMYLGIIGMLGMPWIYKLCFMDIFGGNEIIGARWISALLGIIVIVIGIMPVIGCRENLEVQRQSKISLFKAILYTIRNRSFVILVIINFIIRFGISSVVFVSLYINIYYVCGSKTFAATIGGIGGTLMGLTSYISLPTMTWLSEKTDKKTTVIICLIIALFGVLTTWFSLTPKYPYMQLITGIITNFGLMGCWLLMSSMVADICDQDELKTGHRREGNYGATMSFSEKVAFAASTALTGFILNLSGYDGSTADTIGVPFQVIFKMKVMLIGVQGFVLVIGIILCLFYPITRKVALETRRILEERNQNN